MVKSKIANEYITNEEYCILRISGGVHGIVDATISLEDIEKCKKIKWYISKANNKMYLQSGNSGGVKQTLLHRYIMDCPKEMLVDHKNTNTLDNRRSNLRICTRSNNNMNRKTMKNNTSGTIGVFRYTHTKNHKWVAFMKVDGKYKNLGYYDEYEDAVAARLEAENKYFGEFKNTSKYESD